MQHHPPSPIPAAPRSGSSPRLSSASSFLRIEQPRAAGAPPDGAASSLPLSSSPAQRDELPQTQPPPSPNRAAPRRGSSPQKQPPPSPIPAAPRSTAVEDPHEAASSFDRAAPRSGSSPRLSSLFLPSNRAAPRSRSSPRRSSLFSPSIEQPRAAGAPTKSSLLPPPSQQLRGSGRSP